VGLLKGYHARWVASPSVGAAHQLPVGKGLADGRAIANWRPSGERLAAVVAHAAAMEGQDLNLKLESAGDSGSAAVAPAGPNAQDVLDDMATFLVADLQRFLKGGALTKARYSPTLLFTDPITRTEGFEVFEFLMNSVRFLFKSDFEVHSVNITGPAEITTRWTMYLKQEQLPWKPTIVLSGKTFYTIDVEKRLVLSHVDEWDSVSHNKFFSIAGLQDMTAQLMKWDLTPNNLETPEYSVLKRMQSYEIRKYRPFIVAETEMDVGSGPAGGSGFGELAKFLFGGNSKRLNMDMTTPVISTAGQMGEGGNRMQFVMSSRFRLPEEIPAAESGRVVCKTTEPGVVAAIEFTGWPVDFEVVEAERKLRSALAADGIQALPGYQLARYNDPGTLPMLRRNEVLIKLQDVQL